MEQEENRRKPTVRGIWEELLRLVYPPKCVFCGTLLEYHQRESYGVCFGRWMGVCARRCRSDPFDLVTWVPVSRRRLRERGFDQCRLLAVQVAKVYGMRPVRTLKKW